MALYRFCRSALRRPSPPRRFPCRPSFRPPRSAPLSAASRLSPRPVFFPLAFPAGHPFVRRAPPLRPPLRASRLARLSFRSPRRICSRKAKTASAKKLRKTVDKLSKQQATAEKKRSKAVDKSKNVCYTISGCTARRNPEDIILMVAVCSSHAFT